MFSFFSEKMSLPTAAATSNQTILELVPRPEIHLCVGVTSYLVESLAKKWTGLHQWFEKNLLVKAAHGKGYEACSIFQKGFQKGCSLPVFCVCCPSSCAVFTNRGVIKEKPFLFHPK